MYTQTPRSVAIQTDSVSDQYIPLVYKWLVYLILRQWQDHIILMAADSSIPNSEQVEGTIPPKCSTELGK